MRALACLIATVLLATPAHAKPPRVNGVAWIGGLELHFDANRWEVNGAESAYDVYCTASDCGRTTIAITVNDKADACTPDMLAGDHPIPSPNGHTFGHAGLTFLVAEGRFDCRTLAVGPVRACTGYDGKTYRFDAPGDGCKTDAEASRSVDEILRGLKPR